ncbi:MAG: hypothetical protein NUV99_12085 [Clostridia bacterium]|jgi:hypothetical protein|nr:hypothetical protein [Clostridia bacterium]
MPDTKYGHLFVLDARAKADLPSYRHETEEADNGNSTCLIYLDASVIPGALYNECAWFWAATPAGKTEADAHVHDFDELVGFFGTDRRDPYDLGGEIELWVEDEKHVLTRSFVVFIPAGVRHCPLIVRRVDRPIFHFTMGATRRYR